MLYCGSLFRIWSGRGDNLRVWTEACDNGNTANGDECKGLELDWEISCCSFIIPSIPPGSGGIISKKLEVYFSNIILPYLLSEN